MSKQVSLETSSTKRECTTNHSNGMMPHSSEPLRTLSLQWIPIKTAEQLTIGDEVWYSNHLAIVTFIDPAYVVITLNTMEYGICVFHRYINRIHIKHYETLDQRSKNSN